MNGLKYLVPNLFTSLSLVSALISINYIAKGEFILSPWLIMLSMIFDFLDGYSARKLNAVSQFGSMFDTMSDFVAFGVTPAFLVYRISLSNIPLWGALTAIMYVICGCFRLIRFTINNKDSLEKKPFTGLPIPIAAGFVALFVIFSLKQWGTIPSDYILLFLVLAVSYLMASKVEYFAMNMKGKLNTLTKLIFIAFIASIIVFFKQSYWVFIFWISSYIIYCLLRYIILKISQLRN